MIDTRKKTERNIDKKKRYYQHVSQT